MLALFLLFIITLLCLFGPILSPWPMDEIDWDNMGTAPDLSAAHYFGTDASGRDLYMRTLHGGRLSFLEGFWRRL